jgi:putative transcriptional regulator
MTMTKKKPSRLAKALLETATDMRKSGLLDRATHDKITANSPMRERARMSQAVFARHLNLTVGYVSQLERGTKQPTGAALALLNVIRRKGIEAIL